MRDDTGSDADFELPPMIGTDERRMHVRAYNYWASLLAGRRFPSVADFDPARLDDFKAHSVLLDFTDDPNSPRLRYVGGELREEGAIDGHGIAFDEVPKKSLLSRLTDHVAEIMVNRAPVGIEAEFVSMRGTRTLYRAVLMPLSSDGEAIDFIYGVINWKELAAPSLSARIAEELAAVRPANAAVRLAETRVRLRTAEPVGRVALTSDGGEFVLLLARRDPAGLAVIEAVPDDPKLLDAALKRLASAPCEGLSEAA